MVAHPETNSMRKFFVKLLLLLIVIGIAYIAGYWPQHKLRQASEQEAQQLRQQLDRSQALMRIAWLENQLLVVIEETGAQNYGTARELSKQFFDGVREQQNRSNDPAAQALLQEVLETRDLVTSGLAQADSSVVDSLKQSLGKFRAFLDQQAKS
jgi:sensor domain CHASE-containing protein